MFNLLAKYSVFIKYWLYTIAMKMEIMRISSENVIEYNLGNLE